MILSHRMARMGPMGPKCETFVVFLISAMIKIVSNIEAAAINYVKIVKFPVLAHNILKNFVDLQQSEVTWLEEQGSPSGKLVE